MNTKSVTLTTAVKETVKKSKTQARKRKNTVTEIDEHISETDEDINEDILINKYLKFRSDRIEKTRHT